MSKEFLKFIHNTIIHWIDKTDIKANIFLGIQLVILGYFLSSIANFSLNSWYKVIALLGFLVFTFFVLFFIFKVIWPRLSTNGSSSVIYFKHLHDKYAENKNQAIKDFSETTDRDINNDLINQIVSLATVATLKYKDLKKAIIFLGIEIILITLLFLS